MQKRQSGFTLVDLMVGLTIGLVALAAVGVVYVNSSKNYTVQESFARMQENGRIALEMIVRDLRQAGYFGCADDIQEVFNHIVDTNNNRTAVDLFDTSLPVDALEAGQSKWYPSEADASSIPGALPNTDAFRIRGLDPNNNIAVIEPWMNTRSGDLHVTAQNGLEQGDFIGVTDCEHADIFVINNANPDSSGSLVHNSGSFVDGYGNDTAAACQGGNSHCLSKEYEGDATIMKFNAKRYYIGSAANGEPALFREDLKTAGREMVPGIENMQLLWGEDTNNDRVPDQYRKAHEVNWDAVVAARVGILARTVGHSRYGAEEEVGAHRGDTTTYDIDQDGTNDAVVTTEAGANVKRRVFYATVLLRNLQ